MVGTAVGATGGGGWGGAADPRSCGPPEGTAGAGVPGLGGTATAGSDGRAFSAGASWARTGADAPAATTPTNTKTRVSLERNKGLIGFSPYGHDGAGRAGRFASDALIAPRPQTGGKPAHGEPAVYTIFVLHT